MRIGIDARDEGIIYGITRYTRLLLKSLTYAKPPYKFYLFSDILLRNYPSMFLSVRVKIPSTSRILSINDLIRYEQFLLPQILIRKKIQIYHSIGSAIPCSSINGCKFIVTLFDVIPWLGIDRDSFASMAFEKYFTKWMVLSFKKADIIITCSHRTKNDAIKFFQLPPNKVRVIYNCISPYFRPLPNKKEIRNFIRKKIGIDGEFILAVNASRPSKNIETLIEAYKLLKCKKKIRCKLVIVGNTAENSQLQSFLERRLTSDIFFTGIVSDRILLYLYNLAALFISPSLYEGFGYPPLEAMACAVPVVVSDGGALPEIVGPAGHIFKRRDILGLSKKILEVLEDRNLRKSMLMQGLNRVKLFSWQRYIKEIITVYKEIYL